MSVPTWEDFALPLLLMHSDGGDHRIRELRGTLAGQFKLTEAELAQLLPSGRQSTFDNRVGWARTALSKSGLIERSPGTVPGTWRITASGRKLLAVAPSAITARFLVEHFPGYREFRGLKHDTSPTDESRMGRAEGQTPEETIEREVETIKQAVRSLREGVAAELLQRVKEQSPEFFEKLVVDLLKRIGYGGPFGEGVVLGKTGDGGVDGVIRGDKLGLDEVYVQAKRWDGTVGRPIVQQFAGALAGVKASKGVLITTSGFAAGAIEYVRHLDKRIALVDGSTLAELMIDSGLGVSVVETYSVWTVDSDYLPEEAI